MSDELSASILKLAEVHDRRGEEIAKGLESIATQLRYIGTGDARGSDMGAIELLAQSTKEGFDSLSSSIHEIAQSIDCPPP